MTLTDPFGSSGSYTKNSPALSFIFSTGGTNPSVVQDAGTFEVETYATVSGTDYAIDDSTFTNVFTPTAATLTAIVSSVSSY